MKKIVLITMLLALFSNCEDDVNETGWPYLYRRSFAVSFYETESIELAIAFPADDPTIIYFNVNKGTIVGDFQDAGEKKEIYDALCEKYGDMSFEREDLTNHVISFQAESFVSVEIVSDEDFDEAHPKGSSLNDLILFDSASSKPYIDSGYEKCDWGNDDVFVFGFGGPRRPYYPVRKKVSELMKDDLELLFAGSSCLYLGDGIPKFGQCSAFGFFHFEKSPTLSKVHNVTVTMTADDGRVFSDTVQMTFEP
ncbi:MAG: hypothetical protein LBV18_06400 [Alistipes sp.]|jgi:hypothetical protein|nr:hypothetical protein [Alistipes sp.]